MHAFNLMHEQEWDPLRHVEKILGTVAGGDVALACWEPGQVSPNHCHPDATEIYFCFSGGGVMRTPREAFTVMPGTCVVHPPGELHEYENGTNRTLLFRVRYGNDLRAHIRNWRGHPEWAQSAEDVDYFRRHPTEWSHPQ